MGLEPTFDVGKFKDAENHAEVIPSGLEDIFMVHLNIAEIHAEIRPYLFERWPRKRYVLRQSFQINASAWMRISSKRRILATLTLAVVLML